MLEGWTGAETKRRVGQSPFHEKREMRVFGERRVDFELRREVAKGRLEADETSGELETAK
jgi:hypothetical protein